jgi:hypothetical protein
VPEVKGINIVEEQDHPMNHMRGEEDIHMVGIHMVEVDGMDTVEEHYHTMNHQPEIEGIDTVEEHYHPMNHRSEVDGMDREDSEIEDVVLARHWTGDGATRHQRARREWEELVKSGCSEGQPMFASQDFNCRSPWCRV